MSNQSVPKDLAALTLVFSRALVVDAHFTVIPIPVTFVGPNIVSLSLGHACLHTACPLGVLHCTDKAQLAVSSCSRAGIHFCAFPVSIKK